MSILSESFDLGDKYLITVKVDAAEKSIPEVFRSELVPTSGNHQSMAIDLALNLISVISQFPEYMLDQDNWNVLSASLFNEETVLQIGRNSTYMVLSNKGESLLTFGLTEDILNKY